MTKLEEAAAHVAGGCSPGSDGDGGGSFTKGVHWSSSRARNVTVDANLRTMPANATMAASGYGSALVGLSFAVLENENELQVAPHAFHPSVLSMRSVPPIIRPACSQRRQLGGSKSDPHMRVRSAPATPAVPMGRAVSGG